MVTTYSEYSVDAEIEAFFRKTSATRAACDARARELAGENVAPFRLESLALKTEVTSLATEVYGSLAPEVSFEGKVGDGGKEPLYVYLMSRTFLALSWNAPQPVSPEYRGRLGQTYLRDLRLLHAALSSRFQPIVQACTDSMDDILSLPMVLLHRDFGSCNIMVDEATCHLVGFIDWAEAQVCPFGLNLHSLQSLTGKPHLRNGRTRFGDYDTLQDLRTIKLARALGLLLSRGFTSRLANKPEPEPIGDDEQGRYNMMSLDGFLINPQTKFDGVEQLQRQARG
ncbi:hypothetical protein QBC33DRAFT_610929 [Phialemonium atrogriseum]|uniref:Aminoglycoside phosphotransferase domain-containing protein n=1 Tax=Phialemonium atrogriseum TaxID=1093897 RepID=A0AAJ0C1K6_9PEZI|nr:uncharacterized protein QBC33DRAFT_610929 [Phialemonium atrogriseum]KAK1767837.1 hypothetical protein QBC33DRAFT_610929 [Phialemonium atrogriseum]